MKIFDLALKDLTRSMRSFFFLGMTLAAPLLITMLMYFAFGSLSSGDVSMTPISVGLVNADVLPADSVLEDSLGNNIRSMFFDESVKSWIQAADYPDEAAARQAVNERKIGVALIIPATFTEEYLAGNSSNPITILQDPVLSIGPTVVGDMVTSMLDGVAGGGIAYQVIDARVQANGGTLNPQNIPLILNEYGEWYADFQRALFHSPEKAAMLVETPAVSGEKSNGLQNMIALVMCGQLIFFSFFTSAYSMQSLLEESEEGTLARLFTTPTSRTTILAGKFLSVLLTVLFQGAALLLIGKLFFKINWGEPGAVILALLGQVFASVGLGVLLVSMLKSTKQAGPVFGGALTALGMISGLFTTNIEMPAAFNAIGNFTPQGWVLKAWKLAIAGQPSSELLLPLLILLAGGLLMFSVGAVLFRRRFI